MDTDSYFTVTSNYTSNSGVRKTDFLPQIHTQIVFWVYIKTRLWRLLFFPHVAFIWKECVWVEEELWCISADPHLDHQRSRPAGHSIPHPRASLPKVYVQQQSDGFDEGILTLRVKSLPSSSVSSRGVCVLPLETSITNRRF